MHRLLPLPLLLALACGGPTGGPGSARQPGAVELGVRRADGSFLEIGDLRGRIVVLFVFGTYDGTSQMAMTPLRELAEAHPEIAIVGIDVEPSARQLIGTFEQALTPPFPITYDPEDRLIGGATELGVIDTVPTLVVLDARGRERRRAVGLVTRQELERMLAAAR